MKIWQTFKYQGRESRLSIKSKQFSNPLYSSAKSRGGIFDYMRGWHERKIPLCSSLTRDSAFSLQIVTLFLCDCFPMTLPFHDCVYIILWSSLGEQILWLPCKIRMKRVLRRFFYVLFVFIFVLKAGNVCDSGSSSALIFMGLF